MPYLVSNWKKRLRIIIYMTLISLSMIYWSPVFAGTAVDYGFSGTYYNWVYTPANTYAGYVFTKIGLLDSYCGAIGSGAIGSPTNNFDVFGGLSSCLRGSGNYALYFYDLTGLTSPDSDGYDTCHTTGVCLSYDSVLYSVIDTGTNTGSSTTPGATTINYTIPSGGTVNATSTTFSLGYNGYFLYSDHNAGSRVIMRVWNNGTKAINLVGPYFATTAQGANPFDKTYTWNDVPSGGFTRYETADIQGIGKYYMSIEIQKGGSDWWDVFGWTHETLFSTTTSFTVATTTQYDKLIEDTQKETQAMMGQIATSTSSFCNLTSFQWYGCLQAVFMVLFVPSPTDFDQYVTDLKDNIYTHAPLGYIKRIQDLLATTTPSAMPVIDYTFSTSSRSALSPILGGQRIYLDPFANATGTAITSITSDGANGLPEKSIWEIVQPFYTTILAIILMIMIMHDITNIHAHGQDRELTKNKV